MNRNMVYPGAIPLDTDVLTMQQNIMSALGFLVQATLGSSTVVDGLACTATSPASMAVQIAPGSIISLQTVDASAFGSLPADSTDPLVKMGINTSIVQSGTLTGAPFTPPGTTGQSKNYLIQAAFQESDGTAVTLPYFNAANPAVPFSGPSNSGTPQNTQRLQTVNLQIKAGTAATTGSQATPTPDSGFVGLYVITVPFAATTLTSGNIAVYSGAPFIPYKLPALSPPGSPPSPQVLHIAPYASAGSFTFTVPSGVTVVDVEVWSAGGGSGGTLGAGTAGQGGGGGAYSRGLVSVTPGAVIAVTVGAGGTGGTIAPTNGGNGGNSTFGTAIACSGGAGGAASSSGVFLGVANGGTIPTPGNALAVPGGASGGAFLISGTIIAVSQGGAAFGTPQTHLGASGNFAAGIAGIAPGGGAGGAINQGVGAAGGNGAIIVRWSA